jgi:hypothetical protein
MLVAWVTPDGTPPVSPEGVGRNEYLSELRRYLQDRGDTLRRASTFKAAPIKPRSLSVR